MVRSNKNTIGVLFPFITGFLYIYYYKFLRKLLENTLPGLTTANLNESNAVEV